MKALHNIINSLLLFGMLISCRTSKEFVQESKKESIKDTSAYRETVKLDTLKAPMQAAGLSIPFHLLRDSLFPAFERSNGRAKVKVQLLRDTLYAEAVCDSLEKVIATKEKELYHYQQQLINEQTTSKQVIVQLPLWLRLALAGGVVLLVVLVGSKIFQLFNITRWAGKTAPNNQQN